jgi:hypothetical protein
MAKTVCVLLAVAACLLLAGCYEVRRTDGLRDAYEKILLANNLSDEISIRQDLAGDKRKLLIDSYNRAVSSVNSFLDNVEAKSAKVIDVPLSEFYTSSASVDLDKFISDAVYSKDKPDVGQEVKSAQAAENDEKDKQEPTIETIEKNNEKDRMEREKAEKERIERQKKETERFEEALVSAEVKMRSILELDGKNPAESYKRFKSLIEALRMREKTN